MQKKLRLVFTLLLCTHTAVYADSSNIVVQHSILALSSDSVTVRVHCDCESYMIVMLKDLHAEQGRITRSEQRTNADNDYTVSINFKALRPGTPYYYRIWFDKGAIPSEGYFHTIAPPGSPATRMLRSQ